MALKPLIFILPIYQNKSEPVQHSVAQKHIAAMPEKDKWISEMFLVLIRCF